MAGERRAAVEKAAALVADVAAEAPESLTGGDPLQQVGPQIADLEHALLAQVTAQLLRRFHRTAASAPHRFTDLAATVDAVALPALGQLEEVIASHRAFQSSLSLAPLLSRSVVLAAQCCAIVVRDFGDVGVSLPLTRSLTTLGEVLTHAVVNRAQLFRPVDAARISAAHHTFAANHAEFSRALAEVLPGELKRPLEPLPPRPVHVWRNEELRRFYEMRCQAKYDDSVPIDALAVLLLRTAGIDTSLSAQEAVMRRLSSLLPKAAGVVSAAELDSCGAEVRRCGGLQAWVHALLLLPAQGLQPGGQPVIAPPAPPLKAAAGTPLGALASTATRPPTGGRRLFLQTPRAAAVRNASFESSQVPPLAGLAQTLPPVVGGPPGSARLTATRGGFGGTWPTARSGRETNASKLGKTWFFELSKEERYSITPLHRAAESGASQAVTELLRCGAGPCEPDEWGATPLHRAAWRGQLKVAEALLAGGAADVHAEDCHGEQAMHVAAKRGDYALVKLLLEHGGSATCRSRHTGTTPEDYARERGHTDVLTLFNHRAAWVVPRSVAVVAAA